MRSTQTAESLELAAGSDGTTHVFLRMPADLRIAIDRAAAAASQSPSVWVRLALTRAALARREPKADIERAPRGSGSDMQFRAEADRLALWTQAAKAAKRPFTAWARAVLADAARR